MEGLIINDINFPLAFSEKYSKYLEESNDGLFKHQRVIAKYMTEPRVRGIIGYHKVGSGKTILALSAAEELDRPTIIMCATSIKLSFIRDFGILKGIISHNETMTDEKEKLIKKTMKKRYNFASLTAFNKYDQLYRSAFNLTEKLDPSKNILEGKTIIVDEVHKMGSFIISPTSKDGTKIYEMMKKAKDVKFIFLSGTPIINDIFSIVPLVNIVSPLKTLLPEDYETFNENFISEDGKSLINQDILTQRFNGLISYYPGMSEKEKKENYPEDLGIEVVEVKMSNAHWQSYIDIRTEEKYESLGQIGEKKNLPMIIPQGELQIQTSKYMIESRTACNFILPKDIAKEAKDKNLSLKEAFALVKDSYFDNDKMLFNFSPKTLAIYKNITKFGKQKHLVYSNFVNVSGLNLIVRALTTRGWIKYEPGKKLNPKQNFKRYISWDGSVGEKERTRIKEAFNSPENINGKNIRVILISPAGTEGIDLKCIRKVHIMEPYWHMTRIQQVIGRAIRYKSHIDLPPKERNVITFVYELIAPISREKIKKYIVGETGTTDQFLYEKAERKQILIDEMLEIMMQSAIDCSFFRPKKAKYQCFSCTPTDSSEKMVFETTAEQFLKSENKCVIPYSLPANRLKKVPNKEGLELYKFQNETYIKLPYIKPAKYIKVLKK